MKWLLINPRPGAFRVLGKYEKAMVPFAPMGLAYLGAALERAGATVKVFDAFADPETPLDQLLKDYRPDVAGVTCLTPTAGGLGELSDIIRKNSPGTKIVLGNIHPTLFHRELLEAGHCDYVIRGEAEETITELSDCIESGTAPAGVKGVSMLDGDGVVVNDDREPPRDLDALARPAWHLFDLDRYTAPPMFSFDKRLLPVLASRGCPYRCYFCAQNVMAPKLRKRDMTKVVDEIEWVHKETGVDLFWFCDAIFPLDEKDAEEFCAEMTGRGLQRKIKWITETRADLVDGPLVKMMKAAGLHMLIFGLESGDAAVLKRIKPGLELEHGRRAVEIARRAGVLTLGLFIVGLPGESADTIRKTIDFSKSIGLDFAKFNRAVPYPGSRFHRDIAGSLGGQSAEKYSSWYESDSGNEIIYSPNGMTGGELVGLQKRALFEFYVRPGLIARHIARRTITPSKMARGGALVVRNYLEGLVSGRRAANP